MERRPTANIPSDLRVEIRLEEYRALYALVSLRLSSLEKRAGLAAVTLTAFLSAFAGLDAAGQRALVIGLPLMMLWLVRTTVTHCKAFEDGVRRIEQIESAINELAGEPLLGFQSRHPSRDRSGGRTGRESVAAVFVAMLTVVVGAALLAIHDRLFGERQTVGFVAYLSVIVLAMIGSLISFARYRYRMTRGVTIPNEQR